jgi:hypothetical protein
MIRLVLLAILMWAGAAGADAIYRWENKDGTITYSDQPPPDSVDGSRVEPEELPDLHVVPALAVPVPPSMPEPKEAGSKATAQAYERFSVAQPQSDSSIQANDGNLMIVLDLQPSLWAAAGHSIHLYLDGTQTAAGAQTSFQLTNVDRGTHTVRAEVKDQQGHTLISTDTVSFTLQRHSRLF